jgi:predicted nucleic acid-binding protein
VIAWLHQERDRCFTSAIVIAQLAYWVRSKEGRQRRDLQDWLRRLVDALGGRILGFNVSVAHVWADQEHLLEKQGKRMPVEDGYIAATAASRSDDRHGKRQGLPPARLEGLQSVQGTASGLKQYKAGDAQDGTVFQEIYLVGSPATAASLAENYVGLPY